MPLWRDNGSQGVLGTLIVNSLNTIVVELLGFSDLLVARIVERLGLRMRPSTASSPASDDAEANQRITTFGHEMSLEPLRTALRNFVILISG